MDARTNLATPYRIEIEGGPVLRCWDPRDAPLLEEAVDCRGLPLAEADGRAGTRGSG